MNTKVLTTHQVAKICHVTMNTVVNWINDGSLKAYKTKGGHRRIRKDDLDRFLKAYHMTVTNKTRILIVDDDKAIRLGLCDLFESRGYDVDSVHNAFMAGVFLESKCPDIVILDLRMPELDGFEVCQYIKESPTLKKTKIIVLTGYPSKDNFQKAKAAGAHCCIAKPVDSQVLFKTVEDLL
ncbi:MAG: response regulator [Candidatus Omnitrophica bacterium]|nr:response regulator [Candidatus Omnitrophota bacterium]